MPLQRRAAMLAAGLVLLASAASAQGLSAREAWARPFLDANGGYRDARGGYYDPKAGTFRDSSGGVLDTYAGYTFPDGSYKTQHGDYWDAPKHTIFLATGQVTKVGPEISSAQMIQALRDNVKANGGYDPDLVRRSMLQAIAYDHPGAAPRP